MTTPTNPTEAALAALRKLAVQLRHAAYDHGAADNQPYKSNAFYKKASDRTDAALTALMDGIESALRAAPSADGRGAAVAWLVSKAKELRMADAESASVAELTAYVGCYITNRATPPQPAGAVDDAMVHEDVVLYALGTRVPEEVRKRYGFPEYYSVGDYMAGDTNENRTVMRAALEAARIGGVPAGWIQPGDFIAVISDSKYGRGISFDRDESIVAFEQWFAAAPSPTPGVTNDSLWNEPTPPVEASGREAVYRDALLRIRDMTYVDKLDAADVANAVLATPSDEPKGNGNG